MCHEDVHACPIGRFSEGMIRIYIFSSNLPPCLYPGLMLEKGAFANFAEAKEYKPGGTVQKSDVNF